MIQKLMAESLNFTSDSSPQIRLLSRRSLSRSRPKVQRMRRRLHELYIRLLSRWVLPSQGARQRRMPTCELPVFPDHVRNSQTPSVFGLKLSRAVVFQVECKNSKYGCCGKLKIPAAGPQRQGCTNCTESVYGCCADNENFALGLNSAGCCADSPHGCCPDNITLAQGPDLAGCPCSSLKHGCCLDKVTPALGPKLYVSRIKKLDSIHES